MSLLKKVLNNRVYSIECLWFKRYCQILGRGLELSTVPLTGVANLIFSISEEEDDHNSLGTGNNRSFISSWSV